MRINQALSLLFLVVWRPVLGQGNRNTCESEMGKNSGRNECHRVVVDGLRAKTKYNGKTGVVRGPLGANGRFPVTVNMTQGVETIALKVANLRAADE
jgi:hypothetical protein